MVDQPAKSEGGRLGTASDGSSTVNLGTPPWFVGYCKSILLFYLCFLFSFFFSSSLIKSLSIYYTMSASIPRRCLLSGARLSIAGARAAASSRVAGCRTFAASTRARNAEHKDERLRFPGALEAKFTTDCEFVNSKDHGVRSCYRVLDSDGKIVDENYKSDLTDEEAVKLYLDMVGVSIMDLICLDAQRQGKRAQSAL